MPLNGAGERDAVSERSRLGGARAPRLLVDELRHVGEPFPGLPRQLLVAVVTPASSNGVPTEATAYARGEGGRCERRRLCCGRVVLRRFHSLPDWDARVGCRQGRLNSGRGVFVPFAGETVPAARSVCGLPLIPSSGGAGLVAGLAASSPSTSCVHVAGTRACRTSPRTRSGIAGSHPCTGSGTRGPRSMSRSASARAS